MKRFEQLLSLIIGAGVFLALLFFILKYTQITIGNLADWLVGFGMTAWLITITLIPWDIYFEAKRVLNDAEISKRKNIKIEESEVKYAAKVAQIALSVAILLHLLSAVGLYFVAYYEISIVGYYGSVASLLLTFLRPAVRLYQYVSERLSNIRLEITHPREDVKELNRKLQDVQTILKKIDKMLDQKAEDSWINQHENKLQKHEQEIKQLTWQIQNLRDEIEQNRQKITKEMQTSIADLKREGKFVDNFIENLVEIVRFIKKV
ncbi:MAG: hypothetical protein NZ551_00220 [Microscillaceae bacterium]|nr:hypothetical protein [Microscillaceae bacterium]MDW8459613.1 hypothetical protein [Cytophagales bacterium]